MNAIEDRAMELEREALGQIVINPGLIPDAIRICPPEVWSGQPMRRLFTAIVDNHVAGLPWGLGLVLRRFSNNPNSPERLWAFNLLCDLGMEHHNQTLGQTAFAQVADHGRLIEAARLGVELSENSKSVLPGTDEVQDLLTGASSSLHDLVSDLEAERLSGPHDGVRMVIDELAAAAKSGGLRGIKSGFIMLDNYLSGLRPGKLILIGARTSIGKTAFALNIATTAAATNHDCLGRKAKVLFFSLETSAQDLWARVISSVGQIDSSHLRSGRLTPEEEDRLPTASAAAREMELVVADTPGAWIDMICQKARVEASAKGVDLVVVDYLQLVKCREEGLTNRYQQVGEIGRRLKALSGELRIPVIALVQLSRMAEGAERPSIAHLRESGDLEQDADTIVLLHRKEREDPRTTLIVAKNRDGRTGEEDLKFIPEYTLFQNADFSESLVTTI